MLHITLKAVTDVLVCLITYIRLPFPSFHLDTVIVTMRYRESNGAGKTNPNHLGSSTN